MFIFHFQGHYGVLFFSVREKKVKGGGMVGMVRWKANAVYLSCFLDEENRKHVNT